MMIGTPFPCEEQPVGDVLTDAGRYLAVVNDPPWSRIEPSVPAPEAVVQAGDMEHSSLDRIMAGLDLERVDTIVGIGGGTALDTAKFIAWRTGIALVQVPSITSVDAGFTDAVGVRVDRRVRYVGRVVPRCVVIDIDLIRSAPPHLNRAGIGDVLSCHTGLHDWRAATDEGFPPAWDEPLARLGRTLLGELDAAVDDVAATAPAGIRFLADAYRRIGAACADAEHSRFEEGSEHFWAYAYEHATGRHLVHGELIAFAVVAMAHLQDNDPDWAASVVDRSRCRAHPDDLGIERSTFVDVAVGLRTYARAEDLDVSIVDLRDITPGDAADAYDYCAERLERRT